MKDILLGFAPLLIIVGLLTAPVWTDALFTPPDSRLDPDDLKSESQSIADLSARYEDDPGDSFDEQQAIQAEEIAQEIEDFDAIQSSSCDIKGNISYNSGEYIYHVPGDAYYDETTINESYGERWFCSEDEAQSAGWRRAYN